MEKISYLVIWYIHEQEAPAYHFFETLEMAQDFSKKQEAREGVAFCDVYEVGKVQECRKVRNFLSEKCEKRKCLFEESFSNCPHLRDDHRCGRDEFFSSELSKNILLEATIEQLALHPNTQEKLQDGGIRTVRELTDMTYFDFINCCLKNDIVGGPMEEIKERLHDVGMCFREYKEEGAGGSLTPLDKLQLTTRYYNLLMRKDIKTIEDLIALTEEERKGICSLANECWKEVDRNLAMYRNGFFVTRV